MKGALVILFLTLSFSAIGQKVNAVAVTQQGTSIELSKLKLKKGLIPPLKKFKTVKGKIDADEIYEISVPELGLTFYNQRVVLFEDTSSGFFQLIRPDLFLGLVSYRSCTCKDSYQVSQALLFSSSDEPVIKHPFLNKVLRKRGDYIGLTPAQKEMLSSYNFKFSAAVEIL